jgi:hypothetical protein
MSRVSHWLARYGPPEVLGTITAVAGSFLVFRLTRSDVAAAYGGALGENLGFYSLIAARQMIRDRAAAHAAGATYGRTGAVITIARLFAEFGPAEALDSLFIRPLAMGLATRRFGRSVGVTVGKIVADVTFYLPVIASYEFQRWAARRGSDR